SINNLFSVMTLAATLLVSGWIAPVIREADAAACNATGTGTWKGTDTANFLNCTGAASTGTGTGNRPGAADTLTINEGVVITLSGNQTITSLGICDTACDTDTTLTHSGTASLTITGTVMVRGGLNAGD